MNKEEAIQKLKEIVKPYVKNEVELENINENTDFINDLNINSANLVDVILDVEEVFDIEIDADSMEKMRDVKSALTVIEEKLSQK
ncbi:MULTISPECIES: acyl carrier protein [unclassified Kaistella]|uniref:acyl carrier protein n=1 Tax=unclassified Kaistella TaxID=2762626 RepID=UPI002732ACF4|nr:MULTISPECIES: phosphopantetheine-binding protein [unclassified Kaistella]MDP2454639.1 phosphopantetheine-binding protein [Kaistella sp. SH11-4b]MDP2457376.1 phosphopantetheine-binding protein [Kaistella sp. SH40-3]MDP2460136.1 phosphopantetheine-binding protein [Kaistella sp. SH19-2b]